MSRYKTKKLHYKEAIFQRDLGGSETLETLLKNALSNGRVGDRLEDGEEVGQKRFLNYHLAHSGKGVVPIYGVELLSYDVGADQGVIELMKEKSVVNIASRKAGNNQEFVRGALYMGVMGDHVVIMQSAGLRTVQLEKHLNWLLKERYGLMDLENYVSLNDYVNESLAEEVKGARSIRFCDSVTMEPDRGRGEGGEGNEIVRVKPGGVGWEAIKSFVGDAFNLPRGMTLDEASRLNELEVELKLYWKGGRRNAQEHENSFMDGIARNMRHIDDEVDYEIRTRSGSVTRDQIKTFTNQSIRWVAGDRPAYDDLFPKMAIWLEKVRGCPS